MKQFSNKTTALLKPTARKKARRKLSSTLLMTASIAPFRVLIVGPSLKQKGGMATVQKLVLGGLSERLMLAHVATHDEGSLAHRGQMFSRALLAIVARLLTRQVDLVHIHVSEKGSVFRKIVLLLLSKAFRRPVVLHTHGCEFHLFHQGLPGLLRRGVNWAFQQADCFIALSDSWRQYYISRCNLDPRRVVSLPNPVVIPKRLPERMSTAVVKVAFLGRVGQRKGVFDLLRALAALPPACLQRVHLTIAGDGALEEARSLLSQLGLIEYVTLLGWVSAERCSQLLAESDVFALPSYNEGLPMALLEAMAWELPVISTYVGGIPELVESGQSGLLIRPGDVDGLRDALQQLIEQEAVRLEMGRQARSRVLPMDISLYCRSLATLFQLAASAQRRPDYADAIQLPQPVGGL